MKKLLCMACLLLFSAGVLADDNPPPGPLNGSSPSFNSVSIGPANPTSSLLLNGGSTTGSTFSLTDSGPQVVNQSDPTRQYQVDMTSEPTATVQKVKPPYYVSVYGSGTAYSLTNSVAAVTLGTTSPYLTLARPGTYLIRYYAVLDVAAATLAAQNLTFELYRTNNTAGVVANSFLVIPIAAITTTSYPGLSKMWETVYATQNSNDVISLYAGFSVSAASAGSATITTASIIAQRIY
jgi:hypothetical protein